LAKSVKEVRLKRISNDNQENQIKNSASEIESSVECDKPTDMFNLLDINCKFKSRIQKFGQELKLKNL